MRASRTQKSAINTGVSFLSQLIVILLGFLSRRVLIYSVGVEYLGINGLMTNILTIFSLAESGIGMSIGYALYKPLADGDVETVKSLMRFFKRAYQILAGLTAVMGLAFFPFLHHFLTGEVPPDANIIYLMFLFSSVVSYLWVYKTTLNSSDQNKYLYTIANTITQAVVLVLKIAILYFWENYIVYLAIDIVTTIVKNAVFSRIVDRRYPYLKDKNVKPLSREVKGPLFTNIKAMFVGKVGYIASQCSDNLVISALVSLSSVGLYSNYTTLISAVNGFVGTFTSGVTASMGNLLATESKEYVYRVYGRIDFINYWLYTFTGICLLCLIEPFVAVWLGNAYILSTGVLLIAVGLYYVRGINSAIDVVKNAAGLFHPDRYVPVVEAGINLAISVVLAKKIGLTGVLLGTLISFLTCSFWTKPLFVYKYVFGLPFIEYVKMEGKKIALSIGIGVITYLAVSVIRIDHLLLGFMLKLCVAVVIPNALLAAVYFRTPEFAYIKDFVGAVLKRLRLRQKC